MVVAALCGLAVVTTVWTPGAAHACSCVALAPESVIEQADAVVWGTPVSVSESGTTRTYVVEVQRSYRRALPERIEISTPATSAACGVELTIGRAGYVVLRAPVDGPAAVQQWTASLCANLVSADDIVAHAGAPLAPLGAAAPNADGPGTLSAGVIAGIVVGAVGGLVVLAALALAVARRFR